MRLVPAAVLAALASLAITHVGCATGDASSHDDSDVIGDAKSETAPRVRATKLDMPEGVSNQTGFIGMMKVDVTGARRFSTASLSKVLMTGKRLFGERCDGVAVGAWEQIKPVLDPGPTYLDKLRTQTSGWAAHLEPAELAKLEDYFASVGDDLRIFTGSSSGTVCGGSGEVFYTLAWNKATNDVLYLIQYPYSE